MSDFDAFLSIITNDTAPERVVQIQRQNFLVLTVNGTNDSSQVICKIRNGWHAQSIFIQIPIRRFCPCIQTIASGQILNIVNIERGMRIRIIIEFAVQSSDKVDSAVNV